MGRVVVGVGFGRGLLSSRVRWWCCSWVLVVRLVKWDLVVCMVMVILLILIGSSLFLCMWVCVRFSVLWVSVSWVLVRGCCLCRVVRF